MAGGLLDRFPHVIFAVEVEDVCDKVEGILIVLNFGVEAGEVETVCQVFLINLAEILVSAG